MAVTMLAFGGGARARRLHYHPRSRKKMRSSGRPFHMFHLRLRQDGIILARAGKES